jgi:hypothetical protein
LENNEGKTCLDLALAQRDKAMVQLILSHYTRVPHYCREGLTSSLKDLATLYPDQLIARK